MTTKRITEKERTEILDQAVKQLEDEGYEVTDLRKTTATLKRGKRFNRIVFIILVVVSLFFLVVLDAPALIFFPILLIYPVYYLLFAKGGNLKINVDAAGNVKGTKDKA